LISCPLITTDTLGAVGLVAAATAFPADAAAFAADAVAAALALVAAIAAGLGLVGVAGVYLATGAVTVFVGTAVADV
jgi:hypothetical protein